MDNLLVVRDLKVNFYLEPEVITAVAGASFDINKNEVVVLAGESGSGKTVTALSLTRIIPANAKIIAGSVLFAGRDLLQLDERSARKALEAAHPGCEVFFSNLHREGDRIEWPPEVMARIVASTPASSV